jgi:hypothetical protein
MLPTYSMRYRAYDVVFAQGLFVAVGESASIATSPDGLRWTERYYDSSGGSLGAVVRGPDQWVAVGPLGSIYLSTDGFAWGKTNSGVSAYLNGVAYANNIFVAVGDGGVVTRSTNGQTWTNIAATATTLPLYSVGFGNGKFVAVGKGGVIVTSDSGVVWSKVREGTDLNLNYIAFHAGTFIAVGDSDQNQLVFSKILTSTNGTLWVERQSGIFDPLVAVAVSETNVVALGYRGQVIVSTSYDTWEKTYALPSYIVNYGDAYYSALVSGNGRFLTVEYLAGWGNYPWRSIDARVWEQTPSPVVTSDSNRPKPIACGHGVIAAPAPNWVTDKFVIFSSINDNDWVDTSTNGGSFGPSYFQNANLRFVGGCFVGVSDAGQVLASVDGFTWSKRNIADSLSDAAYGAGSYVVVGNCIYTSRDRLNWTQRLAGLAAYLNGVAYGNNRFVAVGDGLTVYTSDDATAWTQRLSGGSIQLKDVAYGNGVFVAVGPGGFIATSQDGITWTRRYPPTTMDLFVVTYGAGHFLVVTGGTPLTSDDGIAWRFLQPVAANMGYMYDLAWDGRHFLARTYNGLLRSGDVGGVPPILTINRQDSGFALSWPAPADGWRLESVTNLVQTALWRTVTNTPIVTGSSNILVLPASSPAGFFQLQNP